AVTLSWELVQGLSTNAHDFWPALKGFISMAFQHKLLKLTHHQAPTLTTALKKDHEKTKTSICTFLSVLVHFSIIIPHVENKVGQLRKALDIILQSCFNHNFSVRLYALLALKRVWSLTEGLTLEKEEAEAFRGLSSVVTACLNQAEALQSTGLGPNSCNSNTIFYTFPSLSELADDEWIPPWKFEKLSFFSESLSVPLRNSAPVLGQLQPGDWVQQDRSTVMFLTCEIFGASGLVLDSLHHLSDKHFQSLSVSSELWLPLLEVKPVELTDFLQLKKSEGYCIVGVEQTANSQNLQDFRFPERTLLLLGYDSTKTMTL
ncbi:hypothetical protein GOODEAATRI_021666, partial [Goodea atripinnis]